MYIFPDRYDLRHVYIYLERVGMIDPQLIGDRFSELYNFSTQPTVDESDEEQEAVEVAVVPRLQYRVSMEERESLLSTGRRLSQYEWTNAQDWRVDSPRSSRFKVTQEVIFRFKFSASSNVSSRFKWSFYCEQCDGFEDMT